MWECRETYVCLGCLRQRTKTAFTFSSKCCLWHHIISEAVKPKNISSDAQMFGGIYMWWPEISSARLISEKKKKTFYAFCCTFVSFIFVVFVIVVFHALFMRIFVFVLPQPYFPPLLFCPDEWCLRFWHCAFSFGWSLHSCSVIV